MILSKWIKVEEKPVLATLYAASSSLILLHHKEYQGEWRQQGRFVKSKIEKTACFFKGESLDVTRTYTRPLRCLDTSG
jgi:hypothetical protein